MEFVQPIRDKKQIDNMKRYLKEKNQRDYILFLLGINTGLRISDLLQLQVEDVLGKERLQLREKKTGKSKEIPLTGTIRQILKQFLRGRQTGPLFLSRKGNNQAISRQQAYDVINDAARAIGITDKIGTHTLRKTFGYHAYKAGVGVEIIQKLLNHSAPSVTLRYLGLTQDELDSVYINLDL